MKLLVEKHWVTGFDFMDPRLPKGVCDNDRKALQAKDKGIESKFKLPSLESCNYSNFLGGPITRQMQKELESKDCSCGVCSIARGNLTPGSGALQSVASGEGTSQQNKSKGGIPQICRNCGSIFGKGYSHKCSSKQMANNLIKLLPQDVKEKIASAPVKEKSKAMGTSTVQIVCL